MQYVLPDYTNCGLNVAAAVLRHFGAEAPHPGQKTVERLLREKQYKNVVVMLFDGMAMSTLADHLSEESFLRAHVDTQMTAVFPPTTVAATTTIESGESPAEHAWLGWSLYLKEIGRIVDVFLDSDTLTGERLGSHKSVMRGIVPYRSICEKLNATGNVQANIVSRYGDTRIDSLDELFETAKALCRSAGRHYVYTYWAEPDHTMHGEGVMSVGEIMRDIDARVARFCAELDEDTLVLLTADHGLIDAEYAFVSDYPRLQQMCERPFHIESRAASFFVKPECRADFKRVFAETIGDEDFLVLKSDEVIQMQLFGPGKEHPKFRELLGDYLVIATGRRCLVRERTTDLLTAVHAGLTAREMYVPLIVGKK